MERKPTKKKKFIDFGCPPDPRAVYSFLFLFNLRYQNTDTPCCDLKHCFTFYTFILANFSNDTPYGF